MSQEIKISPNTPVVSGAHIKPLGYKGDLDDGSLLLAAWAKVETGFKQSLSAEYITEQVFHLLEDNPRTTEKVGWKVDHFWIRENLVTPAIKELKQKSLSLKTTSVASGNHALTI